MEMKSKFEYANEILNEEISDGKMIDKVWKKYGTEVGQENI